MEGTECTFDRLQKQRILPSSEIPPHEFLFTWHDIPCFARGELVAVTGKAKSGKTYLNSILMAAGGTPQSPITKNEVNRAPVAENHQLPISQANVLVRNYPLTPEQLKKKYRLKDGGDSYLIGCRVNGKPMLFEAERI